MEIIYNETQFDPFEPTLSRTLDVSSNKAKLWKPKNTKHAICHPLAGQKQTNLCFQ